MLSGDGMASPELGPLERAGSCYLRAGDLASAARCYLDAGAYLRAANLYEQVGDYRGAVEALTAGEISMDAAWILADRLGDTTEARRRVPDPGRSPWAGTPLGSAEEAWRILAPEFDSRAHLGALPRPTRTDIENALVTLALTPDDPEITQRVDMSRRKARDLKEGGIDVQDFETAAAFRDVERRMQSMQQILSDMGSESRAQQQQSLLERLVLARCDVAERAPERQILPVLADARAALRWPESATDQRTEDWAVTVATAMPRFDHVALIFATSVQARRTGAVRRWQSWSERMFGTRLVLPTEPEPEPEQ
ncbi:hypothetical protein J5X84_15595 [Streptosporangiaceae bacterium NEAU-GS5]|nr:hypothetical protein [Streptosporangiaceae bacterium NEAU-GS5]